MRMEERNEYFEYCEMHPEIPLFQQAWWQACVAGNREWGVFLKKKANGEIIAFMPYLVVRKFCFKFILQPLLSQSNGIWGNNNECGVMLFEDKDKDKDKERRFDYDEINTYFFNRLKRENILWFQQFFHPSYRNVDVFKKEHFDVTERHTYTISLSKSVDFLFQQIVPSKRRQIKKADRCGVTVIIDNDIEKFITTHHNWLNQRGELCLCPTTIEHSICEESIRREQGVILWAKENEEDLAALLLVYDKTTAYYLIPTYNWERKTSGASAFLAWHSVLYAKSKGLSVFDFEGGNQENLARTYRELGGKEIHYWMVEGGHPFVRPFVRLLRRLKDLKKK